MAKTDRLLYLINLIKSHRSLTPKQLAEKCGVSERTIFRDVNSLASATLPIYYDHGYKFLEGAFLPTINLTDEEFSAMQFAFEFSPLRSQPALFHLAKSIHAKLEASRKKPNSEINKDSNHAQEVETTSSHELSRFSMMFKLLNLAITKKRVVKIKYKNHSNRVTESLIEPYALVQNSPKWLILCYCHDCKKIASYDVGRIRNISLTPQSFKSKINLNKVLAVHQ